MTNPLSDGGAFRNVRTSLRRVRTPGHNLANNEDRRARRRLRGSGAPTRPARTATLRLIRSEKALETNQALDRTHGYRLRGGNAMEGSLPVTRRGDGGCASRENTRQNT
jgi:hypothetical protein